MPERPAGFVFTYKTQGDGMIWYTWHLEVEEFSEHHIWGRPHEDRGAALREAQRFQREVCDPMIPDDQQFQRDPASV